VFRAPRTARRVAPSLRRAPDSAHGPPAPRVYFAAVRARQTLTATHSADSNMKLFGFWRSLATYRVRTALALKGVAAPEVSINILKGAQHGDDYKAVNPQSVVPALIVDDGGPPLFQSLAILEYLEETHPTPPLRRRAGRGGAGVRGLALVVACDAHPLIVPRIREFLEKDLRLDEPARNRWLQHWTLLGLQTLEAHVAKERETGRF